MYGIEQEMCLEQDLSAGGVNRLFVWCLLCCVQLVDLHLKRFVIELYFYAVCSS